MPEGTLDLKPRPGKPKPPETGCPSIVTTHYEIRVIRGGVPTPLCERADTFTHAREAAAYKAKALGQPSYFELAKGERLSDQTADGGCRSRCG